MAERGEGCGDRCGGGHDRYAPLLGDDQQLAEAAVFILHRHDVVDVVGRESADNERGGLPGACLILHCQFGPTPTRKIFRHSTPRRFLAPAKNEGAREGVAPACEQKI